MIGENGPITTTTKWAEKKAASNIRTVKAEDNNS